MTSSPQSNGYKIEDFQSLTRRDLNKLIDAIAERKAGYKKTEVATNINDEQIEKIDNIIAERLKERERIAKERLKRG